MHLKIPAAFVLLSCLGSSALAGVTISPSVRYTATPVKQLDGRKISKDIEIQKVQLVAAAGASMAAIRNINLELKKAVKEFKESADDCHRGAQGYPWSYESKIEKILLTKKYISFVFARFTVCGGSPDIERDPIVFSIKDGQVISAKRLFMENFPGVEAPKVRDYDKRLLKLSDEMADALVDQSKLGEEDVDRLCEFYLKTISYRIWVVGDTLALFPEFNQADSICQKEYFINVPQ